MLPDRGLRRNALLLATAGAIEFALQTVIPVILVRSLDQSVFGQYRLLWLLANTASAIAPAFMPSSLFYFLARTSAGERGLVIGNVVAYCAVAGAAVGLIASSWNPLMQSEVRSLFLQTQGISSLFLLFWILASVTDVLPTADGRIRWQAGAIIGMSLLRSLLLVAAALTAADIFWLSAAMLCVAAGKVGLLGYYLHARGDAGKLRCKWQTLKQQLAYSLPFAASNALFLMRAQGDQWIVVSMLTPAMYATFSVASVVQPVSTLIRQPVINAMMHRLNAAHARGDSREIARLIARSNGAAGMLLIPVLGALLIIAPQLVSLLYTTRYLDAAPVMQVYLIGMIFHVIAVGHVLPALGKGRFAAASSLCCLVLSLLLSVTGLHYLGLPGAALGSVVMLAVNELWSLKVISRTIRLPMRCMIAWGPLGSTMVATLLAAVTTIGLLRGSMMAGLPWLIVHCLTYGLLFLPLFLLVGGRRHLDLVMGWRRTERVVVHP